MSKLTELIRDAEKIRSHPRNTNLFQRLRDVYRSWDDLGEDERNLFLERIEGMMGSLQEASRYFADFQAGQTEVDVDYFGALYEARVILEEVISYQDGKGNPIKGKKRDELEKLLRNTNQMINWAYTEILTADPNGELIGSSVKAFAYAQECLERVYEKIQEKEEA
jgi:hypothetical protein